MLQVDWIRKDCSPRNSSSSFPSSSPSLSLSDESAGTEDRAEIDSCLKGRNWKEYYGLSQELPTISTPTPGSSPPYLHSHSACAQLSPTALPLAKPISEKEGKFNPAQRWAECPTAIVSDVWKDDRNQNRSKWVWESLVEWNLALHFRLSIHMVKIVQHIWKANIFPTFKHFLSGTVLHIKNVTEILSVWQQLGIWQIIT